MSEDRQRNDVDDDLLEEEDEEDTLEIQNITYKVYGIQLS